MAENAINTVVTEESLRQVDALIQKITVLDEAFDEAIKSATQFSKLNLSTPATSSGDLNQKLIESSKIIQQLQADSKVYRANISALQAQLDKLTQSTNNNVTANKNLTQEKRNQIINDREIRKGLDQEAVAQSNLTSFIAKLSAERQKASRIVADYNAQLALGNTLSDQQQKELAESTAAFMKYDAAIKAGKQSIGDAREYVGQYERANWGLNNSINQITRELPAFTFNAQTGFLALSNNIPILADEINRLKDTNKALIAQGKPQVSVIGQIITAFLSWNTALSLAITLTTVYGKEIGNFVKSLFNANKELTALEKTQTKLNSSAAAGRKNAIQDKTELVALTKIARDKRLSDEERKAALDEIRGSYYFYFKQLSDGEILEGKTGDAVRKTTQALEARERANIIKTITDENKAKIMSLQIEQRQAKLNENYLQYQKEKERIEPEIAALLQQNLRWENEMIRLRLISQGLDVKEQQNSEKSRERFQKEIDFLASDYELRKKRAEMIRDSAQEVAENERVSFDDRSNAASVYHDQMVKLAQMEQVEMLRLLDLETQNTIEQYAVRFRNGEISENELAETITAIQTDKTNKILLIEENYLDQMKSANKDATEIIRGLWEAITDQQRLNFIDNEELENIKSLGVLLNNIEWGDMAPSGENIAQIEGQLQEVARLSTHYARKAEMERLAINEESLRRELSTLAETEENILAREMLQAELTENLKQQADIRNEISQEEVDNSLLRVQTERDINEQILEARLELYRSLQDLGNQLFQNELDQYDRQIEKSNEYYDSLLANAEKGSEQELVLQEQKAKREEELQKKKVELQRKQAIFNKLFAVAEIGVELAKAVSAINIQAAVLRANPVTAPLSALALAQIPFAVGIAAAQVATVLATPLPQYKHGRKGGPEEYAIVGDGGRQEVIEGRNGISVTPDRPTLVKLNAGDTVHKSLEDFEKSKLAIQQASIMASFASQSNQAKAFDHYILQEFKGLSGKIEKGIEKGFKKSNVKVYVNMPKIDNEHLMYKNKGFNA